MEESLKNECCIICNSKNVTKFPAKFSDYIANRVFDGKNKDFEMCHCNNCGFAFYSYRFSDDEISKLYTDYRTSSYQKQRQKYDTWYTEDINRLIGNNKTEIESRGKNLTKILKNNIDISEITSVLDYGGDKGLFIPEIFANTKRYVYDISGRKPNGGIIGLSSIDQTLYGTFGLILCAHVIEHVNNPNEFISSIKAMMNPGQYLYIELPFDSPFYSNFLSNIQYIFNPHYSLKNIIKQYTKLKSFKGYLMNEHINYFTQESAEKLLSNNGFKILESGVFRIKTEIGNTKIISVLGRL